MKMTDYSTAHGRLKEAAQVRIKPSHVGRLHKKLGVPEGKPIPMAAKIRAAHSSNPATAKQGTFAVNSAKWKRG